MDVALSLNNKTLNTEVTCTCFLSASILTSLNIHYNAYIITQVLWKFIYLSNDIQRQYFIHLSIFSS